MRWFSRFVHVMTHYGNSLSRSNVHSKCSIPREKLMIQRITNPNVTLFNEKIFENIIVQRHGNSTWPGKGAQAPFVLSEGWHLTPISLFEWSDHIFSAQEYRILLSCIVFFRWQKNQNFAPKKTIKKSKSPPPPQKKNPKENTGFDIFRRFTP